MSLEFSDAQKQALAGYGKPFPANADVRRWAFQDRMDLLFSYDLITIFLEAEASWGPVCSEICVVPKYTLAAVSPIFAEHLLQKPELESFVFDVGHMDKALQEEHRKALNSLNTWLLNLATHTISDLKAPTFYSEISLRHIARQLGMRFYLTDRSHELVCGAQTHTLQPWQITELLYASSVDIDATFPIVMENDPLLGYLARKTVATADLLWGDERNEAYNWLRRKENKALESAMQRLQEGR
ncbi:hypothetical protein P171DRAFT_440283 [Karstenula rhodostoma CBS 690.94]|uniref:Uncharacterized protein n=1 Tax=Karstenula rhodostoma CBS 690.94 TaxID=1392251 RepID=A0A9P4PVU3_9PLEO|nr:hypothetical protein P171DRAFT_440283 [Karstenula rhodostoma CBS 690.94]